jgi:hypothetical protein
MIKLEEASVYNYDYKSIQEGIEDALIEGIESFDDKCSTQQLQIQTNVVNIKVEELGGDNDYDPFA